MGSPFQELKTSFKLIFMVSLIRILEFGVGKILIGLLVWD